MRLSLTVSAEGIYEKLKALNAALDPEEIADECEAIILNRIRTRFLDEEGPNGPWPQSKAAAKRRAKGGTGTLFDTGLLFHSIQASRGADGERFFQSDVPYGRYHQDGIGQEKRVFLGFNDDDIDVVKRLIAKRIKDHLK